MPNDVKLKFRGVDGVSKVIAKIQKKLGGLSEKMGKFAGKTGLVALKNLALKAAMGAATAAIGAFGAAFAAVGVITKKGISYFIEFEKGLFGVRKTTGISGQALKKFGREIQDVSKRLPIGQDRLLEFAQAAGQLGVKGKENILGFTKVLGKLELATDIAGSEGAQQLARFVNLTGDIKDIENYGAAVTDLGNNFAATEGQILRNSTEVAKATVQYKIGGANAFAFGTALKSVGVEAEAGGTTIGKTFRQIEKAIEGGGEKAQVLSKLTGIAVKDLKSKFAKDSALVFRKFIGGLKKVQTGQGSLNKTLGFYGLTGDRVLKNLVPLIEKNDILEKAVKRSNEAFKQGRALNEEVAIQNQSLAAQLQRLSNQFEVIRTKLGEKFAPALIELSTEFGNFLETIDAAELKAFAGAVTDVVKATKNAALWAGKWAGRLGDVLDKMSLLIQFVPGAGSLFGAALGGKKFSEAVVDDTKAPTETFQPKKEDFLEGVSRIRKLSGNKDKSTIVIKGRNLPPGLSFEAESEDVNLDVGRTGTQ